MKRVSFVLIGSAAAALAFAAGCGSTSTEPPVVTNASGKPLPAPGRALRDNPGFKLDAMKTPQEKVAYMQSLLKDPNYKPKRHVNVWEKYSKDPDPDVAANAKDLLDKAK